LRAHPCLIPLSQLSVAPCSQLSVGTDFLNETSIFHGR
jgi:hypothetical protein